MASPKNPTKHNDSPNTPGVDESRIARMKADDLRDQLSRRGVKGTEDLKKPELVKKLVKALVAEDKAGSKKAATSKKATTSKDATPKKTLAKSSEAKSSEAKSSEAKSSEAKSTTKAAKNPTSGNDTPDTPEVNESDVARMKAAELRRRLADRGVKGTDGLKKPELVEKMVKALLADAKDARKAAKKSGAKAPAKDRGVVRTGKQTPSSLKYSQEITSTKDRPERAGRSLVTTDHEVIRQWAKARKAVPTTVQGTEHGGHLGVLRLDFPGYSGDRLTEVSWDDWLGTFDKRRLNFIYQEKLSSGKRSNFFQLQSPDGVDD